MKKKELHQHYMKRTKSIYLNSMLISRWIFVHVCYPISIKLQKYCCNGIAKETHIVYTIHIKMRFKHIHRHTHAHKMQTHCHRHHSQMHPPTQCVTYLKAEIRILLRFFSAVCTLFSSCVGS